MKDISELDISNKMKIKLIRKEIYRYQKKYIENLKINDPEAYEKIRKKRLRSYKNWKKNNPDYLRKWFKNDYKKNPKKYKKYNEKAYLKKALSGQSKGD